MESGEAPHLLCVSPPAKRTGLSSGPEREKVTVASFDDMPTQVQATWRTPLKELHKFVQSIPEHWTDDLDADLDAIIESQDDLGFDVIQNWEYDIRVKPTSKADLYPLINSLKLTSDEMVRHLGAHVLYEPTTSVMARYHKIYPGSVTTFINSSITGGRKRQESKDIPYLEVDMAQERRKSNAQVVSWCSLNERCKNVKELYQALDDLCLIAGEKEVILVMPRCDYTSTNVFISTLAFQKCVDEYDRGTYRRCDGKDYFNYSIPIQDIIEYCSRERIKFRSYDIPPRCKTEIFTTTYSIICLSKIEKKIEIKEEIKDDRVSRGFALMGNESDNYLQSTTLVGNKWDGYYSIMKVKSGKFEIWNDVLGKLDGGNVSGPDGEYAVEYFKKSLNGSNLGGEENLDARETR